MLHLIHPEIIYKALLSLAVLATLYHHNRLSLRMLPKLELTTGTITITSSPFVQAIETEADLTVTEAPAEAEPILTNSVSSWLLSRYLSEWNKITLNNFILRIISEGYKIQFIENPIFPSQEFNSTKIDFLTLPFTNKFKSF